MALFIRQVTGILSTNASESSEAVQIPITLSPPGTPTERDGASTRSTPPPDSERLSRPTSNLRPNSSPGTRSVSPLPDAARGRRSSLFSRGHRTPAEEEPPLPSRRLSLRRALSVHVPRPGSFFRSQAASEPMPQSPRVSSLDVGGPRFGGSGMHHDSDVRRAGEPWVYQNGLVSAF